MMIGAGSAGFGVGIVGDAAGVADAVGAAGIAARTAGTVGMVGAAGLAGTAGVAAAAATCGLGAPPRIANRSNSPIGAFAGIVGAVTATGAGVVGFATGRGGGVWLSLTTGCSMVVLDHPVSDGFGFVGDIGVVPVTATVRISSMIFGPAELLMPRLERGS